MELRIKIQQAFIAHFSIHFVCRYFNSLSLLTNRWHCLLNAHVSVVWQITPAVCNERPSAKPTGKNCRKASCILNSHSPALTLKSSLRLSKFFPQKFFRPEPRLSKLSQELAIILAASPFLTSYTVFAQDAEETQMTDQTASLSWGHININVSNLDTSIAFYEKLGFEIFITGIL